MQEKRRQVTTQVSVRIATILVPGVERLSTTAVKQTAFRVTLEMRRQVTTQVSVRIATILVPGLERLSTTTV
jgi:hypothetical protein